MHSTAGVHCACTESTAPLHASNKSFTVNIYFQVIWKQNKSNEFNEFFIISPLLCHRWTKKSTEQSCSAWERENPPYLRNSCHQQLCTGVSPCAWAESPRLGSAYLLLRVQVCVTYWLHLNFRVPAIASRRASIPLFMALLRSLTT